MSKKDEETTLENVLSHDLKASSSNESPSDQFDQDDGIIIPDGGRKAWINLGGAFLGFTGAMGIVNSNGAVQQFISSDVLPSASQTTIGWIFSLFNFLCFGMVIFAGPLFASYGSNVCLSIGTVLFAAGYMSLSESKELYQFILSSILSGIGLSFSFTTSVGIVGHYFRKRRAFCLGIGFSGGAIGGIIFPVMMRSLFPKFGFGWTIKIVGFVIIALQVGEFLLVSDRRTEIQTEEDEKLSFFQKTIGKIQVSAFKEREFSSLVVGMMCGSFSFVITLTYIISYAVAAGYPYHTATTLTMIMNGTSILGRSLGGYMADRYGRFNVVCIIYATSSLCYLILWLPHEISHTYAGLVVFSAFYGIALGSNISLGPAAVGQISKTSEFTARYGTTSFCISLLNLAGIPAGGAIIGAHTNLKGFDKLVIFITCISLVGTFSAFLTRYFLAGFAWKRV